MFSEFVQVSPENINKHKYELSAQEKGGIYTFKLKGRLAPTVWLIKIKGPQPGDVNFRNHLWNWSEGKDEITVDTVKVLHNEESSKEALKEVNFNINKMELMRSFIFIDHPTPVEDGGYYFSFRLSDFT